MQLKLESPALQPYSETSPEEIPPQGTDPLSHEQTRQTQRELAFTNVYDTLLLPKTKPPETVHDYISESLSRLAFDHLDPEKIKIIHGIIEYDTKILVSRILPRSVVYELGIAEEIGWSEDELLTIPRPEEFLQPDLKNILLLASVCDVLNDEKLLNALSYLVTNAPRKVDEELATALMATEITGDLIMPNYRRLHCKNEVASEPSGPEYCDTPLLMRKATHRKIPHLERQVKRKGREPRPDDTGYV